MNAATSDIFSESGIDALLRSYYLRARAEAKDRLLTRAMTAPRDDENRKTSFVLVDEKIRLQYTGTQHYSFGQDAPNLIKHARYVAKCLKRDFPIKGDRYPVLLYSGMSGISHATAISLQLEKLHIPYGMIYVRKHKERSNSYAKSRGVEESLIMNTNKKPVLVFVDDLISSGRTMFWCYWRALKANNLVNPLYDGDYYVAIAKSISRGDNFVGSLHKTNRNGLRARYKFALESIQKRIAGLTCSGHNK